MNLLRRFQLIKSHQKSFCKCFLIHWYQTTQKIKAQHKAGTLAHVFCQPARMKILVVNKIKKLQ